MTTRSSSNARPESVEPLAFGRAADGDDTAWLITFSDLVLQLFAFVLIVAVFGGATRHAARSDAGGRPVATESAPAGSAGLDVRPEGRVNLQQAAPDVARAAAPKPDALTAFQPAPRPDPLGALEATAWAGDGGLDRPGGAAQVEDAAQVEVVRVESAPEEHVNADPPAASSRSVRKLGEYLGGFVAARGVGDDAAVIIGDTDVRLDFGGRFGFPTGRADLLPAGRSLLRELQRIASGIPNLTIEVAGYTDDVPIHTREYPSNLELSLARAARVAREIERDDPSLAVRTVTLGLAEQRAIAPNDGPENRARNRRVEVRLVPRG